jgi:UDP-GlcNAc:undecaprenyl-phosphate/decaprenyl-phosphate GlcNAc-1-phosphate transferase
MVVAPLLLALAAALAIVPTCRRLALRLGFVAQPRADRWHTRPIALLGGVGIGLALFLSLAATGGVGDTPVLVTAAVIMFALGLADDIWSIKPATRLVIEIGVASLFLFFGYRLHWLTSITADSVLTLVWIVGLTNAFNLLDNMDGLCGGVAVIAGFAFLAGVLPLTPDSAAVFPVRYLAALLGAVLGFLAFNVYPARLFMGDSGSLLIGVSFAGLPLMLGSTMGHGQSLVSVVAVPVIVLLIPILDTTFVTLSRLVSGRPTSLGGRDHTSHRLVAIGLSERAAVMLLWLLAAAGGGIGVVLHRSETWGVLLAVLFVIAMTIFATYLGGIRVYDHSDATTLERGGLTPIVVNFMYKRRIAEVLLDFLLVAASYYAAYRLKFDTAEFGANFPLFLRSLPIVITVQLAAFFLVGVYQGLWHYFSTADAVTMAKGVVGGTAGSTLVILYLYRFQQYSWTLFVIYAIVLFLAIVCSRASFNAIGEALQRRRQGGRRIVIYGAGGGGAMAVRELLSDPDHDVRIVGFIDDDPNKRRTRVRGYPVLGTGDALPSLITSADIDVVVLSMRSIDEARKAALEALCAQHDVLLTRLYVALEPSLTPARDWPGMHASVRRLGRR